MALVLSVQHWRPYLLGRKFVVYSDQKSLKYLLQQRITTADQQNWLAKLLGYQFEVVYKPDLENKAVDSLSRLHGDSELRSLTTFPIWLQLAEVQKEVRENEELKRIIEELSQDLNVHPKFSL